MVQFEGALRSSLRDELSEVGFTPLASKLYQPSPGSVARSALVEHVSDHRADVVTVIAPAGYGKSTFIAELAAGDPRPTAWVSLTPAENDPAGLLTYIALALDEIEPVDAGCVTALWGRAPTIGSPTLHRFGGMLAGRRIPFVLVLDDVHELVDRDILDVLPLLVAELPPGSAIVLGSRTAVPLPLGRLRVKRRVVEVGLADLAFDRSEAGQLLAALAIDAAPDDVATLVEHTEGWPAAVYLAALAHGTVTGAMTGSIDRFAGDHRYLAAYLDNELLGSLDPDVASFLIEAACFERMSGPLLDEVLGRHGSAQLLEDLQRQNLLIIPLDDRREWYRFHHLFAELLSTELARRDPARATVIHRRASDWCDAHGDGDGAVTHAVRAGDLDHAESMVIRWLAAVGTDGQLFPTTGRWVETLSDDQLLDRPLLMVVAGISRFGGGQSGPALQFLARAAAAVPDRHPDGVHGVVTPVALAMARSFVAPLGPAEMKAEACYVYDHVGLGDGHPMSCLTLGAAAFMVGDEAEASRRFREGADTTMQRGLVVANCLAHLAIIDVENHRWPEATAHARRATELIGDIAVLPCNALVLALAVLVETRAGRAEQVEAERRLCRQHLTALLGTAPWLNLQARIALARAARLRGNPVEATALLDEADAILETIVGADHVAEQLTTARREVASRDRSQTFGPSSLTTAELRVLQLLPTHLSVGEIAERLYVSRNTVKSQTIAIYRKLGTSSRAGAVALASTAGLLDSITRNLSL